MVVGWRRDHAGTQPLNMNIAPSFLNEFLITANVDYERRISNEYVARKWGRTLDPGPDAFMIRDFRTSAGEQTVVATVPYCMSLVVLILVSD